MVDQTEDEGDPAGFGSQAQRNRLFVEAELLNALLEDPAQRAVLHGEGPLAPTGQLPVGRTKPEQCPQRAAGP